MKQENLNENLLKTLNGADYNATIKTLQYLIAHINLARSKELVSCIKDLSQSPDTGVRFWSKKLVNNIGKYETEQANTQIASLPKDLPVDILIQKLQAIASTFLSLDIIKKLCESRKPEALSCLITYLSNCKDNIQISYLTKNIGIYFPLEENLSLLMPYLKHSDDRIVANTIEGIEAINSPKGVVILSQLLEHKSNRVRTNAAIALGKFDSEKAFAVISKMLSPEADAHFKISACHAIKTLRSPKFLELLELALHDDLVFTASLEAIAAIGGQAAIDLLADNYSQFPNNKQTQIDNIAATISQTTESSLKKLGEKIFGSQACAKANIEIEEYREKLHTKLGSVKQAFINSFMSLVYPIATFTVAIIIVVSVYSWVSKPFIAPSSAPSLQKNDNIAKTPKNQDYPNQSIDSQPNYKSEPKEKKHKNLTKPKTVTQLPQTEQIKTIPVVHKQKTERKIITQTSLPDEPRPIQIKQQTKLPNVRDYLAQLSDENRLTYDQKQLLFERQYKGKLYEVDGEVTDVGTFLGRHYVTLKVTASHFFDVYTAESFDIMKYSKGQTLKLQGDWDFLGSGILVHHQIKNAIETTEGIREPTDNNKTSISDIHTETSEQFANQQTFSANEPAVSPKTSDITWTEFNNIFSINSNKSEFQKENLWKKYEGLEVCWSGEATEIHQGIFNSVSLLVRMNSDTFTFDVSVDLKPNQFEKALEIQKGQRVKFKGILESYGGAITATRLKNGEILN